MPIKGNGWEMLVMRSAIHQHAGKLRTYGTYQVHLDGTPVAALEGFVCESPGPGDNGPAGVTHHRRIAAGRYRLSTHFGERYETIGYSNDLVHPATLRMPGILVTDTGDRSAILIHPGHPPTLFLSSIGCLNPTGPLAPDQLMDFWDSRARVISIIDSLRAWAPAAFAARSDTQIQAAALIIDGEPSD